MSRKDYILIAETIKDAIQDTDTIEAKTALLELSGRLAYQLERDNGAFNKDKFLQACR